MLFPVNFCDFYSGFYFKYFFIRKYIKIFFFIFKKLILILTPQYDLKILKNIKIKIKIKIKIYFFKMFLKYTNKL
jgi:hypothetical protein